MLQCHFHCRDRSTGLSWLQSEINSSFEAYGVVLLQMAGKTEKSIIFEAVDSCVKVNPYIIWFLAYPDAFAEVISMMINLETVNDTVAASLLEAVLYVQSKSTFRSHLQLLNSTLFVRKQSDMGSTRSCEQLSTVSERLSSGPRTRSSQTCPCI